MIENEQQKKKESNHMNEREQPMSCADCARANCHLGGELTSFCETAKLDPELLEEVRKEYLDHPEVLEIMQSAAAVEYGGYGVLTRVQEIAEFAKRMGYKKIGIATCVGLLKETRITARILRSHGLEVYGIGCKAGRISKQDMGIPEECNALGQSICNPILQAALLERYGTEYNIVIGLCVGHDSLFYRYSKAPVSTLICKDRVLGHNPAAALYMADGFYAKKLFGDQGDTAAY